MCGFTVVLVLNVEDSTLLVGVYTSSCRAWCYADSDIIKFHLPKKMNSYYTTVGKTVAYNQKYDTSFDSVMTVP